MCTEYEQRKKKGISVAFWYGTDVPIGEERGGLPKENSGEIYASTKSRSYRNRNIDRDPKPEISNKYLIPAHVAQVIVGKTNAAKKRTHKHTCLKHLLLCPAIATKLFLYPRVGRCTCLELLAHYVKP